MTTQNTDTEKEEKFNTIDFVTANVKIHDALILLQSVNYDVVETLIKNTPDEIKNTKSYLILEATLNYYSHIVSISSTPDNNADTSLPTA